MAPEQDSPRTGQAGTAPAHPGWLAHRAWWIAGCALVLLAGAVTWRIHQQKAGTGPAAMGGPGGPPGMGRPGGGGRRGGGDAALTVGVAQATLADVPVVLNALGTVTPLATVSVRPQVTGPVTRILFSEGQPVKAGALLAEIDPRPYQATLDQALAQQQRDQAQLANARRDLERYRGLLGQGLVSDQQFATQQATVAQDEALVAADAASVEGAQLNRNYCNVRSPVDGVAGLRQVDLGNLVQANGSTAIVVVTQVHPISVLFTVPEDDVRAVLARVRSGAKLAVEAWDRSQSTRLATGRLSAVDNQVDTTTGTVKLRAQFENADGTLFPNQFVNVRVVVDTLRQRVVVPGAAVQSGSSGTFVYVTKPDDTVAQRVIRTGLSSGELMVVESGLQAGETVVTDGADQLRDGAAIRLPGTPLPEAAAPAGRKWGGQGKGQRGQGTGPGMGQGAGPGNKGQRSAP